MTYSCSSDQAGITVVQGNNRTLKLTVVDATGQRQDLTGFKIYFTVKDRYEDVSTLISKRNTAAGGSDTEILIVAPQSTAANKGRANIFILPEDTACLAPGTYVCDVLTEDLAGVRTTVVETAFVVKPRVTVLR